MTDFVENETMLINDHPLSREALGEFYTKPERQSRQRNSNSYIVKLEDGTDEKV